MAKHTEETFPAIYLVQNAPTEPSRLQVTPSWPLVALRFLFSGVRLSFARMMQMSSCMDYSSPVIHAPVPQTTVCFHLFLIDGSTVLALRCTICVTWRRMCRKLVYVWVIISSVLFSGKCLRYIL